MSNKLYEESSVSAIAAAIRTLRGTSRSYKIAEMAPEIKVVVPADMSFGQSAFTTFPAHWTFAPRTSCVHMFENSENLTAAPNFDVSTVTDMSYMFMYCGTLSSVPAYNTTAALKSTYTMFRQCYALQSVPLFNTSGVTNMSFMFSYCLGLTSVPAFNTSSVEQTANMFSACEALVTAPSLDLSKCQTVDSMFYDCKNLKNVPIYNLSSLNSSMDMWYMFELCSSLTNASLQNIVKSLLTTSATMSRKELSDLGLSSSQGTYCTSLSEWSTLASRGWTWTDPNTNN